MVRVGWGACEHEVAGGLGSSGGPMHPLRGAPGLQLARWVQEGSLSLRPHKGTRLLRGEWLFLSGFGHPDSLIIGGRQLRGAEAVGRRGHGVKVQPHKGQGQPHAGQVLRGAAGCRGPECVCGHGSGPHPPPTRLQAGGPPSQLCTHRSPCCAQGCHCPQGRWSGRKAEVPMAGVAGCVPASGGSRTGHSWP